MTDPVVIRSIRKNVNESIVVRAVERDGGWFTELRIMNHHPKLGLVHTPRGLFLRQTHCPLVMVGMREAEEYIRSHEVTAHG